MYFFFIAVSANIINLHTVNDLQKWLEEPNNIYIGRAKELLVVCSKWYNPYKIGPGFSRTKVIILFEEYILEHEELLDSVRRELAGKTLGCWCAPKPCHGEFLHRLAGNCPVYQRVN